MRFEESITLLPPMTRRQLAEYRALGSFYIFRITTTRANLVVKLTITDLPDPETLDQNIFILRNRLWEMLFLPPGKNTNLRGHITNKDFNEAFASFHIAVVHAATLWHTPCRIPPEKCTRPGMLTGSGVSDNEECQAYVDGRLVKCTWMYTRHVKEKMFAPGRPELEVEFACWMWRKEYAAETRLR